MVGITHECTRCGAEFRSPGLLVDHVGRYHPEPELPFSVRCSNDGYCSHDRLPCPIFRARAWNPEHVPAALIVPVPERHEPPCNGDDDYANGVPSTYPTFE